MADHCESDNDALVCTPEDKARLETENGVKQVDYIDYLIHRLGVTEVRESHIRELHRLAVEGIYPCGGKYRDARAKVRIDGSDHKIAHESLVPSYVQELITKLNADLASGVSDTERAAYALWRLNWIHPFSGGNGRTARALSYLILCIDMGGTLPGVPQMPTLIYDRRADYIQALRAADASALQTDGGQPDIELMVQLVEGVLDAQLDAVVAELNSSQTNADAPAAEIVATKPKS